MHFAKSLLTVFVVLPLFALLLGGCGLAEHSVNKTGRVLEHGERKLERHL